MSNTKYYLGFSYFQGIGPLHFKQLLNYFDGVEKAYTATEQSLTKVIGVRLARLFIEFRKDFNLDRKLQELRAKEIQVLCHEDINYPHRLSNLSNPPICLYLKGELESINFLNDRFIGVVGTRKATAYGLSLTKKFSSQLAEAGFVIVSGIAMGIDGEAHRAAIDVKGKTIAVLGGGVDSIFPIQNKDIYQEILNGNGVIVSEYPPGLEPQKGLFVMRNRIIAALSEGLVLIEGSIQSGAYITAKDALELGREIFCPPVPLDSITHESPTKLLKDGATLLSNVNDILTVFGLRQVSVKKISAMYHLTQKQNSVCLEFQQGAKSVDELLDNSKYSVTELLSILSSLEIKGVVKRNKESKYELM